MPKIIYKQYKKYKWIILAILALTVNLFTYYSLYVWYDGGVLIGKNNLILTPVFAQTLTPEVVSEKVYQQIPDFPLENNYLNVETKEVASENTLITRIVRYHQYTKSRPTIYRLDWKLTLADYLGKNEIINENLYPNSTLTENPLKHDRIVIQGLTRQQRDKLVNVLVSIYNPTNSNDNQQSLPNQETKPSNNSPSFQLPQQGGADLLLP